MCFPVLVAYYLPKCFVEAAVKRKIEQKNVTLARNYEEMKTKNEKLKKENVTSARKYEEMKTKYEKLTKEIAAANIEKFNMRDSMILAQQNYQKSSKLVKLGGTQVGKLEEEENKKLKLVLAATTLNLESLKKKLDGRKEMKHDQDHNYVVVRPSETGIGMDESVTIFFIIAKYYVNFTKLFCFSCFISDSNFTFESPKSAVTNAEVEFVPSRVENFEFSRPEKASVGTILGIDPLTRLERAFYPTTYAGKAAVEPASVPPPLATVHPRQILEDHIVPSTSSGVSPYFAPTSKRPREEEIEDDSSKKARKGPSETVSGIVKTVVSGKVAT